MSSKIVFVTGASGFIGSAIVRVAVFQGYQVRGLSRSETSDEKIRAAGGVPVRGDLQTLDVLSREAGNADIVCNLGDAFFGSNFTMPFDESTKIMNAAVDAMAKALEGTNKALVVANGALITRPDPAGGETVEADPDDPTSFVDRGKPLRHALAWATRGVRVSAIRLAPFVYGHGGSGVAFLLQTAATAGASFVVDGGAAHTSVVHVDDAARLFLLAAEKSAAGESYNGVSDTTITFADLASEVAALLGVPAQQITLEQATAAIGPFFANFLTSPCRGSSEKARRLLGWQPTEIGLIEDLRSGSYPAVAAALKKKD